MLIQRHFGLDKSARDALSDEEWVELAAAATWLEESLRTAVRNGVVEALNEMLGR